MIRVASGFPPSPKASADRRSFSGGGSCPIVHLTFDLAQVSPEQRRGAKGGRYDTFVITYSITGPRRPALLFTDRRALARCARNPAARASVLLS